MNVGIISTAAIIFQKNLAIYAIPDGKFYTMAWRLQYKQAVTSIFNCCKKIMFPLHSYRSTMYHNKFTKIYKYNFNNDPVAFGTAL